MQGPVIHSGEVTERNVKVGPIEGTWSDLGTAAGSLSLGLRRLTLPPGGRSTPAHVHSGEEEIFVILEGSGLSWQDGATYEVRAGDCLVHPEEGPAHTLVAGPDGLSALAFGERAPGASCFLPRSKVAWMGTTWVKAGDTPHPYAQEAAAGELELPEAPSARPSTIVAQADVPGVTVDRGDTGLVHYDLGRAAGSRRTGLRRVELRAGRAGFPPHCHACEEELYVVLEGSGVYLLQDAAVVDQWRPVEHPVVAGDVVSARAGAGLAHTFRAGSDGLAFLAYGQREPGDLRWYPRSKKIVFPGLRLMGRVEPLSYWDGEE